MMIILRFGRLIDPGDLRGGVGGTDSKLET